MSVKIGEHTYQYIFCVYRTLLLIDHAVHTLPDGKRNNRSYLLPVCSPETIVPYIYQIPRTRYNIGLLVLRPADEVLATVSKGESNNDHKQYFFLATFI